jgi:spore maturation protein CgeB
MKFVFFSHSFSSCWNHGNAHFLRGVTRELIRAGHEVTVFEPEDGWSRTNALHDGGAAALAEAAALVPGVRVEAYQQRSLDLDAALDHVDVVIVHEWNPPKLVAALGRLRAEGRRFILLFHDTHHRGVTAPHEIEQLDLDGYDAVLAFGEVLRQVYLANGWATRVFTWHEAADTALFRPLPDQPVHNDLIWIGNWGDDERTRELEEFLIVPARRLGLRTTIHGVRYPAHIRQTLAADGFYYAGWLPNHRAPLAFAGARMTVHVPRRPYVAALPGIPTIRVFEALACAIPLICSPWPDCEGLFPAGSYVTVATGDRMASAMRDIRNDPSLGRAIARTGYEAILARHTCRHRVNELMAIVEELRGGPMSRRQGAVEQTGMAAP